MDYKKIRIIPFDGKKANWHMWSRKFLCKLTVYGYRTLIKDLSKVKIEEIETEKTVNVEEEGNDVAYSDLLLSMEDDVCFNIVDLARTDQYPMGCTNTAFSRLKEKFDSTTQAERCEHKLEYESLRMKKEDDPEVFINQLEKIGMRMKEDFNMEILEDDLISKVLNTLPPIYDSLVDSIHIQMNSQMGITLVSLKEQLRIKYQRLKKSSPKTKGETILYTQNNKPTKVKNP